MGQFTLNIQDEGQITSPLTDTGIAGEDVFRGTLCYLNQDGKYWKADASDASTCTTELRIAQEDLQADESGNFIEQGTYSTLGLTVGERYYVSTTPGEYTTTQYNSPSVVRYIGTASSETKLEFNPMDVTNEPVFFSLLNTSLAVPANWWDSVVGLTVADFQNLSLTAIIELIFLPDVAASISVNPSLSVSGVTSGTVEVGTNVVQNFNVNLNKGTILNGDQTTAGTVIGDLATVTVTNPDAGTGYTNASATGTSDNAITANYVITQGTNTWSASATNVAGTTTYTNNKGDATPVTSIENAKADTTQGPSNFSMYGAYKRFHTVTTETNSPTTSVTIRALTNSLLSTSNTGTWDVSIGAGASNAEFSFYIPQGETINVIDLGNLNLDITNDFTTTSVSVDDANGDSVNYTKYTRFAGALGFTNSTTFRITVT